MKILRITDLGFETGGIESGIVLVQPILERKGHEVRTMASDVRPDLPHFNRYGFKSLRGLEKVCYAFNPHAYAALSKVLKEFEPDVVHLHTMSEASPSILFLLGRYPTVLTVHGPEPFIKNTLLWCFPESDFRHGRREAGDLTFAGMLRYLYHRLVYDPVFALGFRNVDAVLTLSRYMHRLIEDEGIRNDYVTNGAALFDEKPLAKGRIRNALLYVGRLEAYKGVDDLLDALPEVLARLPDTMLTIAGDGGYRAHLEASVKDKGLKDAVAFTGHVDRARLERLYQEAAILVMPSAYPEAFGKVGIEAMSVGRPVIATDVGGIAEWLIDGETGLLVPPKDPRALGAAIVALLSDHGRLRHMGERGRKKAEEFSLEAHAERMEKVYTDVASRKK
jgi:glycosyltransferase involved in cell wall biosynthesis